jgi:hypothetical protein
LKIEETGESVPRNGRLHGVRRLDGALVKRPWSEPPHQSGVQPPHSRAPFQSLSAISKQALNRSSSSAAVGEVGDEKGADTDLD